MWLRIYYIYVYRDNLGSYIIILSLAYVPTKVLCIALILGLGFY